MRGVGNRTNRATPPHTSARDPRVVRQPLRRNGMNSKRNWFGLAAPAALVAIAAAVAALTIPASSSAQEGGVDWANVNNTLDGQRYSPLADVNTSNVTGLKVAWRFRVKTLGAESYPVVVGGAAYVTTTYGNVYALDAVSGKKLWTFDALKLKNGKVGGLLAVGTHGFPNRGVAVGGGRVYGVTPNAVLYSLDQATGKL